LGTDCANAERERAEIREQSRDLFIIEMSLSVY